MLPLTVEIEEISFMIFKITKTPSQTNSITFPLGNDRLLKLLKI